MRIAYVSLHWPRTRNSGVGKKIQSQVAAWNASGHESLLFMHSEQYEPQSELIEAEYSFYTVGGIAQTEINRIRAMDKIIEAVREYRPDLIYLRYGMYVYPAHRLMDIAPVVEEINTNDLIQHKDLGRIYSSFNRITRGIFLRRIHGLVTVSSELSELPAFASYGKPTIVIANGIDLDLIKPLPPPNNPNPHLLFIGTPGYDWHGVDKLTTLGRIYPDLIIDVIGYDQINEAHRIPSNIHLHGYMESTAYEKVIGQADIAISTLALHRKQMEEGSPLKTREYLAYGLPVVLAYIDTDLIDLQCDFILNIPNREDNILTHAPMIRDFAYRMRGQRADRQLLAERIDSIMKETQRLAFFKQFVKKPI